MASNGSVSAGLASPAASAPLTASAARSGRGGSYSAADTSLLSVDRSADVDDAAQIMRLRKQLAVAQEQLAALRDTNKGLAAKVVLEATKSAVAVEQCADSKAEAERAKREASKLAAQTAALKRELVEAQSAPAFFARATGTLMQTSQKLANTRMACKSLRQVLVDATADMKAWQSEELARFGDAVRRMASRNGSSGVELAAALADPDTKVDGDQSRFVALMRAQSELKSRLDAKDRELASQRRDYESSAAAQAAALSHAQGLLQDAQQRVEDAERKNGELTQSVSVKQSMLQAAEASLSESRAEVLALRAERDELRALATSAALSAGSDVQTALSSRSASPRPDEDGAAQTPSAGAGAAAADVVQSALAQLRAEHERNLAAVRKDYQDKLHAHLQEAEQSAALLRRTVEELSGTVGAAQAERDAAASALAQLNGAYSQERAAFQSQIQRITREHEGLQARCAASEDRVHQLQEELAQLKERAAAQEAAAAESVARVTTSLRALPRPSSPMLRAEASLRAPTPPRRVDEAEASISPRPSSPVAPEQHHHQHHHPAPPPPAAPAAATTPAAAAAPVFSPAHSEAASSILAFQPEAVDSSVAATALRAKILELESQVARYRSEVASLRSAQSADTAAAATHALQAAAVPTDVAELRTQLQTALVEADTLRTDLRVREASWMAAAARHAMQWQGQLLHYQARVLEADQMLVKLAQDGSEDLEDVRLHLAAAREDAAASRRELKEQRRVTATALSNAAHLTEELEQLRAEYAADVAALRADADRKSELIEQLQDAAAQHHERALTDDSAAAQLSDARAVISVLRLQLDRAEGANKAAQEQLSSKEEELASVVGELPRHVESMTLELMQRAGRLQDELIGVRVSEKRAQAEAAELRHKLAAAERENSRLRRISLQLQRFSDYTKYASANPSSTASAITEFVATLAATGGGSGGSGAAAAAATPQRAGTGRAHSVLAVAEALASNGRSAIDSRLLELPAPHGMLMLSSASASPSAAARSPRSASAGPAPSAGIGSIKRSDIKRRIRARTVRPVRFEHADGSRARFGGTRTLRTVLAELESAPTPRLPAITLSLHVPSSELVVSSPTAAAVAAAAAAAAQREGGDVPAFSLASPPPPAKSAAAAGGGSTRASRARSASIKSKMAVRTPHFAAATASSVKRVHTPGQSDTPAKVWGIHADEEPDIDTDKPAFNLSGKDKKPAAGRSGGTPGGSPRGRSRGPQAAAAAAATTATAASPASAADAAPAPAPAAPAPTSGRPGSSRSGASVLSPRPGHGGSRPASRMSSAFSSALTGTDRVPKRRIARWVLAMYLLRRATVEYGTVMLRRGFEAMRANVAAAKAADTVQELAVLRGQLAAAGLVGPEVPAKMKELHDTFERLRSESRAAAEETVRVSAQLEHMSKARDELLQRVQSLLHLETENATLRDALGDTEMDRRFLLDKQEALKAAVAESADRLAAAQAAVSGMQAECAAREADNKQLQARIHKLYKEREHVQSIARILSDRRGESSTATGGQEGQGQGQGQGQGEEEEEVVGAAISLLSDDSVPADFALLREQASSVAKELRGKVAIVESLRAELSRAQSAIHEADAHAQAAVAESSRLKRALEDASGTAREVAALKQELQQACKQLMALGKEGEALAARVEAAEAGRDKAATEAAEAQAELRLALSALEDAQAAKRGLEKRVSELSAQLEATTARAEQLQADAQAGASAAAAAASTASRRLFGGRTLPPAELRLSEPAAAASTDAATVPPSAPAEEPATATAPAASSSGSSGRSLTEELAALSQTLDAVTRGLSSHHKGGSTEGAAADEEGAEPGAPAAAAVQATPSHASSVTSPIRAPPPPPPTPAAATAGAGRAHLAPSYPPARAPVAVAGTPLAALRAGTPASLFAAVTPKPSRMAPPPPPT